MPSHSIFEIEAEIRKKGNAPGVRDQSLRGPRLSPFYALGDLCDLIVNFLNFQCHTKISRILNELLEQQIPSGFQFFKFNSVARAC